MHALLFFLLQFIRKYAVCKYIYINNTYVKDLIYSGLENNIHKVIVTYITCIKKKKKTYLNYFQLILYPLIHLFINHLSLLTVQ